MAALLAVALVLGGDAILAIAATIGSIPLRLPINYNEGWNAYRASDVLSGRPLYPAGSFVANNYPPLSFYVVAWASRSSDPIVAGRWLSLASFAAWAVLLVAVARRLGARRGDAWAGAALFATTMLLFTEYVGIDDPEMLGHALAGLGLLALLFDPASGWRVAAAALLCVLAAFVKQTLVVVPAAIAIWLWTIDVRSAWRFVTIGLLVAAAGSAWCVAEFGVTAMRGLATPRAYTVARALGKAGLWSWRLAVPAAMTIAVAKRFRRDAGIRLCAIYAAAGAVVGVVLSGGDGINANVFFDAIWAVSLGAALALTDVASRDARRRVGWLLGLAAPLLVAVLLPSSRAWVPFGGWIGPRGDVSAASADIAFLTDHAGRGLCEQLALCYWAGKPIEADLFQVRQAMLTGGSAADDLAQLVEARAFSVVQLDAGGRELNGRFARAMEQQYVVARAAAGRRLYVPR